MTWTTTPAQHQERQAARKAANLASLCVPVEPRGSYSGGTAQARPKAPAPIRDEAHRRRVAGLPCFQCRIQGYSQAAHPNSGGKAKGRKQSDLGCFPMCCDRPGVVGCHSRFDRYELIPRANMPAYEAIARAWTTEQLASHAAN